MNLGSYLVREKILLVPLFSIYFLSTEAANRSFPALYAFGDSILDTGNNNKLLTFMKGNVWPYGKSSAMKLPSGRFGNGRVFSDIIAEGLGIKKFLPAYRKRSTSSRDLKTGVCFASGGAGVDPVTSKLLRVLKPSDQINDFKGCKRKLRAAVGASKAKNIISRAVFLISQGNNDLGISYFSTPSALARGLTRTRYISKLTGWNKKFMKGLYNQGARKFAVMGVIPIGCVPMTRLGVLPRCNFWANKVAEDYNRKLKSGCKSWGREAGFRGAKFVYVDMFNTLSNVIKNYRRYGFINAKKGCCCMPNAIVPCRNPNKYVFFDFVHPSEKAYKIISKKLVKDIKRGLA
ncbi:unnamed protein product [Cochlearia groenlandica]